MKLRDYQIEFIPKLREELKTHKSVFMQLHTGGGKTVIVSAN